MMGSSAYFEVYTVRNFKYGDFQKASRISLREPSLSINSSSVCEDLLEEGFYRDAVIYYMSMTM